MATFGENLRRERELRGISLREIADATKISARFLQALEQDRYDVLPGGLFRRTFVRQYAKYVGLDADRTVAEFLYTQGAEATESSPGPRRFALPNGTVPTLAGIALLVWLAMPWGAARHEAPAPAVANSLPAAIPLEHVYPPAAPPEPPPSSLAGDPSGATSVSVQPKSDGLVLTLAANQDCWVSVSADGATVLDRVLSAGETQTLEAHGEIVLSVGNAGGLSFRVNDQPGAPLGKSGEVKKNIVITRQSLPSLLEEATPSGKTTSG
jgi:cytoskeletal protein RodZ